MAKTTKRRKELKHLDVPFSADLLVVAEGLSEETHESWLASALDEVAERGFRVTLTEYKGDKQASVFCDTSGDTNVTTCVSGYGNTYTDALLAVLVKVMIGLEYDMSWNKEKADEKRPRFR